MSLTDELNEARATAETCQRAVQTLRLELEAERAKVVQLVAVAERIVTSRAVRLYDEPLEQAARAALAKAGGA